MVLRCINSGSEGNCYTLTSVADEILIIEAGVSMKEIKKNVGWNTNSIIGCVVTHSHKDHSLSIKEIARCGIPVLATHQVLFSEEAALSNHFYREIKPLHGYILGSYKITVLPAYHDVPCVAFLIEHEEMGRLFFMTDSMMLKYKLPECEHIMIEANYSDDIIRDRIEKGSLHKSMRDRLMSTHMELHTLQNIIRENDISTVEDIVLLHLSDGNSNEELFQAEIEKVSGKPVYIAKPDFSIEYGKR